MDSEHRKSEFEERFGDTLRPHHRHLSYRVKLFLHTLVLVLAIIGVMVAFMYHSERQIRSRLIREQLDSIERNIIYAYEQEFDMQAFLNFLDNYLQSSLYDQLYITAYDANDSVIAQTGPRLEYGEEHYEVARVLDDSENNSPLAHQSIIRVADRDKMFFFSIFKSDDGNLTVLTALPYSFDLREATSVNSKLWWLTLAIAVVATASVWLATRMMGRNIKLLRNYSLKAADSKLMHIDDAALPHDELGEISRVIFHIYNERIEAMQRAERDHRIAIHAVQERARIKHQLTNNINHELKTPVGVIKGYLDTIAETPDMDAATRDHFLERARKNVDRLCALLNDVSTITRLEDGAESIPVTDVNFHDLAVSVEHDVESSGLAGGMKLEFDVPVDCVVRANESLLSGMLLNLVKNAAIHSHGSTIGLKLVSESRKFYVFAFWDDGDGVDEEHIPHLFERFYRVDQGRSRKAGGTGLGLPIVKNTVLALGGAISVHNRSTGGLEYTFTLPKAD